MLADGKLIPPQGIYPSNKRCQLRMVVLHGGISRYAKLSVDPLPCSYKLHRASQDRGTRLQDSIDVDSWSSRLHRSSYHVAKYLSLSQPLAQAKGY